jgi:dienelactone hydrolase
MIRYLSRFVFFLILFGPFFISRAPTATAEIHTGVSPQDTGPCAVTSTTVEVSGGNVDFHMPLEGTCADGMAAPYPAVVFAHGFSLFGFSDGRAANQGNGQHLASWGYVVAIPSLPDGFEERAGVISSVLNFIELATDDDASFLYRKVNQDALATVGYSLGGATALAIAARESRVRVVVALDPVFHEGGPSGEEGPPVWDAASEAPNIMIPAGILGSPADSCNANADHQDLYALIGSRFKASYEIVGASHCVFADPGNEFCSLTCGGTVGDSQTGLSQKYMTAWLNYHLKGHIGFYSYLYGAEAEQDINANLIIRQVNFFPQFIFLPTITR